MKISVIVPTYRRPLDLDRCLEALARQIRTADEVIVTVRDNDNETWSFFETFICNLSNLKTIIVQMPGVVAAMNLALDIADGDIIAFTDDDAAPHVDWLKKIEAHFLADDTIGGLGGRDYIYKNNQLWKGEKRQVGHLLWFGKMIGNHHLGIGEPREVDILKGVNMSFRRKAILENRFDSRMLGSGAQVHFEVEFCLKLKKSGWKLIYDPHVAVDHYFAQRFDEDQRDQFNELAFFNEVHNETLALMDYLSPLRRLAFFGWSIMIGHRRGFGLLQVLRFLWQEKRLALTKLQVTIWGRWQGWITWNNKKAKIKKH
jgi:cellulose synthase/poly-beta-1,6-N-acetylglucosamine synthase-like glycosyltransferase